MGSLRIRCVKLNPGYGAGTDNTNAVQISTDGLVWWTLNRFATMAEALEAGKALESFSAKHITVKPEFILWKTKV